MDIEVLKNCCIKVLPLVYDESLSYYEVVCKLTYKINEIIKETNDLDKDFKELSLYVKNLNLQDEVNAAIKELVDSGYISDLLNNNRFYGKNVCFIGDSITYGDDSTGNKTKNPFPEWFGEITGANITNLGTKGATISTRNTGRSFIINQIDNIPKDTDIVFVQGGYNDFQLNNPIGDESYDSFWFKGALKQILSTLISKGYDVRVIGMTPTKNFFTGAFNPRNSCIYGYIEAIKDVCRNNNILYYDTMLCGINRLNYTKYIKDSVHLTNDGYKLIAEYLSKDNPSNLDDNIGFNLISPSMFINSVSSNLKTNNGICFAISHAEDTEFESTFSKYALHLVAGKKYCIYYKLFCQTNTNKQNISVNITTVDKNETSSTLCRNDFVGSGITEYYNEFIADVTGDFKIGIGVSKEGVSSNIFISDLTLCEGKLNKIGHSNTFVDVRTKYNALAQFSCDGRYLNLRWNFNITTEVSANEELFTDLIFPAEIGTSSQYVIFYGFSENGNIVGLKYQSKTLTTLNNMPIGRYHFCCTVPYKM